MYVRVCSVCAISRDRLLRMKSNFHAYINRYAGLPTQAPGKERHAAPLANPLTNTSMSGCISAETRSIIAAKARGYPEERMFYEHAKFHFWNQVARVLDLEDFAPERVNPV